MDLLKPIKEKLDVTFLKREKGDVKKDLEVLKKEMDDIKQIGYFPKESFPGAFYEAVSGYVKSKEVNDVSMDVARVMAPKSEDELVCPPLFPGRLISRGT